MMVDIVNHHIIIMGMVINMVVIDYIIMVGIKMVMGMVINMEMAINMVISMVITLVNMEHPDFRDIQIWPDHYYQCMVNYLVISNLLVYHYNY